MHELMKFFAPFVIFFSCYLFCDDTPISHASIGVMGDHTHQKDEIMISLRISSMKMRGNLLGSNVINDNQILELLIPVNQNKNNLQMQNKNKVVIGYQKAF